MFSSQPGEESLKISNDLIVRKLGHFSEYMALGFFSFCYLSSFLMKNNKKRDLKKTVILSLLFSIIYASSDEFHQSFVVGRDGNIIDVLIDSSGSLVGVLISSMIYFFVIKK